jgi:UBX domain-containing protein 7
VQARTVARENSKWIVVSIHDPTEFPCQMLNRDLWKDKAVKDILKSSFIFLQVTDDISGTVDGVLVFGSFK